MRIIRIALAAITPLVLLGGATHTAPVLEHLDLIGSGGGSSFERRCPDGHVLTGIRYRIGAVVDGIGIRCRSVGATSGNLGASLNVGSMAGGNGGTAGSKSCDAGGDPNGSVIADQSGGGAGVGIADLRFACKQWLPESRAFGVATRSNIVVRAGTTVPSSDSCSSSNSPAIGIHGRHGAIVDAVGLICGRP